MLHVIVGGEKLDIEVLHSVYVKSQKELEQWRDNRKAAKPKSQ
jgi:hypothetical protein